MKKIRKKLKTADRALPAQSKSTEGQTWHASGKHKQSDGQDTANNKRPAGQHSDDRKACREDRLAQRKAQKEEKRAARKEAHNAARDQRQRRRRQKRQAAEDQTAANDFLDRIAPAAIRFWPDHCVCGSTYRCVWALREYPPSTDAQAILRHLGEKDGVTLHLYLRQVTPAEEKKILHNATNRHRLARASTDDLRQAVTAQNNLQEIADLISKTNREREPLVHCAVYIGLCAPDPEALRRLQAEVHTELVRAKLHVDRLLLCQQEGFACISPVGANTLGAQFERVMPASSAANLYPFGYSGKTDARGFYVGRDRYGSNVLVDFDQRDADKTSANILILGNSGQGKSYLMKLLLLNLLESGKSVISLDAEHEQQELCEALGGCFIDLMAGEHRINVLEVKCWDDGSANDLTGEKGSVSENPAAEDTAPPAFWKSTRLAQHISFLKDFFRAYKDFSDAQIDVIELMLTRLYERWNISETTDLAALRPQDYPVLSDLYNQIEREYRAFSKQEHPLYTQKQLQEILLGLHSLCRGADARFFNGHTNISSGRFLVFGV